MSLNKSSILKLEGVHPDLQRVIYTASDIYPGKFVVTEGLRSIEKQKALVAAGASQTMKSRHLDGHAVDLAVWIDVDGDDSVDGGEIRWDWELYKDLAQFVKEASEIESVPIEWGGDWLKFKDGPHFQLPWKAYP